MCSRLLKGMVLLAALATAMIVGAVFGGGAVYVLTRADAPRPVVEVRAGHLDSWHDFPPSIPHGVPVPMWSAPVPVWGTMVLEVVEDSPASTAGLQEGDVIVALDGEPVLSPGSLVEMIAARNPGDQVELTVYRLADRAKYDLQVTLGEHPTREGVAYLGVWLDSEAFGEFGSEFFEE